MPNTNRFDPIIEQLANDLRKQADAVAESWKGGQTPVGQKHLTRHENLRHYLLFAVPGAMLPPEQLEERQAIWDSRFKGKSELELKEFQVQMERLRQMAVGPQPEETQEGEGAG